MKRQYWQGMPLLAPLPAVLVSCGDAEHSNLITIGWNGIINTHPPRLAISVRPERFSYGLITQTNEFVVNLPNEQLVRALDWCGVKSGKDHDKFAELGLHKEKAREVSAPILSESPVCLECRVFDRIPLGSHELFLADILSVDIDEQLIDQDGKLHLDRAHLVSYAHGEYFALGKRIGSFGCSVRKKKKNTYKSREGR